MRKAVQKITFFWAKDPQRTGPGGGDESEDIVVHEVPVDEVEEWLAARRAAGVACDVKIYAAMNFVRLRQ